MSYRQLQASVSSLKWVFAPPSPYIAACAEADIQLLDGSVGGYLRSWWQLASLGALDLLDQGPYGLPFVDNSGSGVAAVIADDTRSAFFPDAVQFLGQTDATGLKADDPSGYLITTVGFTRPFTIGLSVRIDTKAGPSQVILTYHTGLTVRYRLRYRADLDLFELTVLGTSGTATVRATSLGSFFVGQWYWIEISYDPATAIAGLRIAPQRSTFGQQCIVGMDCAVVPGGLDETPGALSLGYYGSGANFGLTGRIVAVGWWAKALNNCERGRLNVPVDYPFAVDGDGQPAAGKLLEGGGGAKLGEGGDTRIEE